MASEAARHAGHRVAGAVAACSGPTPRLLGIDGRSGSGKTSLAREVAACLSGRGLTWTVVTMDDLYPGWDGLAKALPVLCREVIGPLRQGRPASYRRYDWEAGCLAERVRVAVADVVVIEGVGSTTHRCRDAFSHTVWVQAPATTRLRRACGRGGQGDFAAHADRWSRAEDALFGPDRYPLPPDGYHDVVDTATGTDTGAGTDSGAGDPP